MTTNIDICDVCCAALELSETSWVCAFAAPGETLSPGRRLTMLGAVGETTATVLVAEVYHRSFETRRHVASFVGLAPSPYKSGRTDHDRGISKAGTKLARQSLVELAWFWLRLPT
jgi:transposase